MRSFVPEYDLAAAGSLQEALRLVADGWQPMAGGTDLMVLFEAGKLDGRRFAGLWGVPELRGIEVEMDAVTLGALTTYTEVLRHGVLRDEFPLLAAAARETGGIATQNRGTLGGNIVNASPAADSAPPLLVYGAELDIVSASGTRRIPYAAFHTGYKKVDLGAGELLRAIRLPRRERGRQYFRKVGTRRALAISKVCFAGLLEMDGDVRIALGSVAPVPLRCPRTEAAVRERPRDVEAAQRVLSEEISPIDDIRSTARYRRRVALNLLAEFMA